MRYYYYRHQNLGAKEYMLRVWEGGMFCLVRIMLCCVVWVS